MKTYIKLLLLILPLIASGSLKAQDSLILLPDFLYTDTFNTSGDTLTFRLNIYNKSNTDVNDFSVTATSDSNIIVLLKSTTLLNIPGGDTLSQIVTFSHSALGNLSNKSNVIFTVSSRIPNVFGNDINANIVVQTLTDEAPSLSISSKSNLDSLRFDDYYPINLELINEGKVDLNSYNETPLAYRINDIPASQTVFYTTREPILSNKRNTITIKDSIPVTSLYFKKGGGNIVVVWPVGFLKTDSVSDTFSVGWPMFIQTNINHSSPIFFPNPAKTFITLQKPISKTGEVRIFNQNGQEIECNFDAEEIWINHLASGNYIIEISINGKVIRQKLIVAE